MAIRITKAQRQIDCLKSMLVWQALSAEDQAICDLFRSAANVEHCAHVSEWWQNSVRVSRRALNDRMEQVRNLFGLEL